jgi:hypothetical protein
MHDQTYREGSDALSPGGLDITIHLSREEAGALGADASLMTDWLHTALMALVALRTGRTEFDGEPATADPRWWYWPINDLEHRLLPRLRGIRDAAIRQHAGTGGSYGHLAAAMDVVKSTAQRRRDALMSTAPSVWEVWARTGGPYQNRTADDTRPAPTRTADDTRPAPTRTAGTADRTGAEDATAPTRTDHTED